jgi:hypothetical protein
MRIEENIFRGDALHYVNLSYSSHISTLLQSGSLQNGTKSNSLKLLKRDRIKVVGVNQNNDCPTIF